MQVAAREILLAMRLTAILVLEVVLVLGHAPAGMVIPFPINSMVLVMVAVLVIIHVIW